MNKQLYEEIIHQYYMPYLMGLGFSNPDIKISGRLYKTSFLSDKHKIDVCYEPGDEFVCVYIYSRVSGDWSDIDDLKATPRLADLNKLYMHKVRSDEISKADGIFTRKDNEEEISRKLIKFARDLYLVLPYHLCNTITGSGLLNS